jgi:hypothetical protein
MPAASKSLMLLLPALALLAACEPAPYHPAQAVSVSPAPPALPGALGAPIAPAATAPLSGGTVAPPPAVAPNVPVRMSANDIVAILANNTAEGVTANGLPYAVYFAANGQQRFRAGDFADAGTWHVLPDGRFCSALVRTGGNVEQCYVMYRTGNAITFQRPDGVTIGNVTVVGGNPQGL